MAQAIACDLCNTETAVLLQTDIDTGQVIAVGAACLFPFYLGAAKGIAESMDSDIKTAYVVDVLALCQQFDDEIGANAIPEPESEPELQPPADVPSKANAQEAAKSVARTRAGKAPEPAEPAP